MMCGMAGDPGEDGRTRLGVLVRQRRTELGLSQSGAADLADVDRATWASLESGARNVRAYNRPGIERAMRWLPGSVERVLAGDEPLPDNSARPPATTLETHSSEQLIKDIWADPDMDLDEKERWIAIVTRADAERAAAASKIAAVEDRLRRSRENRNA